MPKKNLFLYSFLALLLACWLFFLISTRITDVYMYQTGPGQSEKALVLHTKDSRDINLMKTMLNSDIKYVGIPPEPQSYYLFEIKSMMRSRSYVFYTGRDTATGKLYGIYAESGGDTFFLAPDADLVTFYELHKQILPAS